MRIYKIAASGDNDALHAETLQRACEAIEAHSPGTIYRAWIEPVDPQEANRQVNVAAASQVVR